MKNNQKERFWEIDFLRGIAIIAMVISHLLYDLNYFKIYKTPLYSDPYLLFLYPVRIIFLVLVGLSLTLSYSKAKTILTKKQLHLKFVKRGFEIFGLGLLITIATWYYLHEGFIIFGILHCIGISIILVYPLIKYRFQNLILGIIILVLGFALNKMIFDFNWLLWLGFVPTGFYTLDYFPLLPWLGVVLIGMFLGNTFYKDGKRTFELKNLSQNIIAKFICLLGKHSLVIYLLHQLIIIAIIYLVFF